ncbi:MAG: hypothetical protein ACJ8FT_01920 [Sphingomonas sp.]
MALKQSIVALAMIVAAGPAVAAMSGPIRPAVAPPGTPETKYCMRIEAVTGTLIETVQCWTREEWADQGVDVDKDWPKEGVKVING